MNDCRVGGSIHRSHSGVVRFFADSTRKTLDITCQNIQKCGTLNQLCLKSLQTTPNYFKLQTSNFTSSHRFSTPIFCSPYPFVSFRRSKTSLLSPPQGASAAAPGRQGDAQRAGLQPHTAGRVAPCLGITGGSINGGT